MFIIGIILFALHVVGSVPATKKCTTSVLRGSGNYEFGCLRLASSNSLKIYMPKGPKNATRLTIRDSKLTNIPYDSFKRFESLEFLELQNCDINVIDGGGFSGLRKLQKLVLTRNKLDGLWGVWFTETPNLRELDVSFNKIVYVDPNFFYAVRSLEKFYFDYNNLVAIDYAYFSLLDKLKRVKLGHNPWDWGFRVNLMRQLDNQKVDHQDDWEEWGWIITVISECASYAEHFIPNDDILNCLIEKLLNMDIGNGLSAFSPEMQRITSQARCVNEASTLVRCSMTAVPTVNAIRSTMEDLVQTLKPMIISGAKFNSNL